MSFPHFHVSRNVEVFLEERGGPTFAAELNEAPGQLIDLQGLGTEKLSLPEGGAQWRTRLFPRLSRAEPRCRAAVSHSQNRRAVR